MLQYVSKNLNVLSSSLLALVIIANLILLLLCEIVVIAYLMNLYILISIFLLYVFSPKINSDIAYKDKYLYVFFIYSVILSMIFAILNRYFSNFIYKYLYNMMVYCLQLLRVNNSFLLYVKYYNIIDNITIDSNRELIDYLSLYNGDTSYDLKVTKAKRFMFVFNCEVKNNYIINSSHFAMIALIHGILMFMLINNSLYMTHGFLWVFIAIGVIFVNFSITNEEMIFMNQFRYMLLLFGFMYYIFHQMYIYQIIVVLLMMICLVYLTYAFFDKEYFYAKSDIGFICKFFYGRYLRFLVAFIMFVNVIWISYMEYMSLHQHVKFDPETTINPIVF